MCLRIFPVISTLIHPEVRGHLARVRSLFAKCGSLGSLGPWGSAASTSTHWALSQHPVFRPFCNWVGCCITWLSWYWILKCLMENLPWLSNAAKGRERKTFHHRLPRSQKMTKPHSEAIAKPVLLTADRPFPSMPSKQLCLLAWLLHHKKQPRNMSLTATSCQSFQL